MNDVLAQLAEANPVQAEDVMSLALPERFTHRLPNRRLSAAIVGVALVAAALVGVFAFNGYNSIRGHVVRGQGNGDIPRTGIRPRLQGPTGANGPTGSEGPIRLGPTGARGSTGSVGPGSEGPGLSFGFLHRTDGSLKSFGVSVWEFQKSGFQLEVRYLGPRGDYLQGGYPVVYRTTVPAASMSPTDGPVGVGPSGRNGPGPTAWTWSGKFSPGDWSHGCQDGDYEIDVDWDATGSFAIDASSDSFSCTGA